MSPYGMVGVLEQWDIIPIVGLDGSMELHLG